MKIRRAVIYRKEEKCIQILSEESEGNRLHGNKLCAILKISYRTGWEVANGSYLFGIRNIETIFLTPK